MRPSAAFSRLLLAAAMVCCLASCSIGYQSEWRRAAALESTTKPTNLDGAWEGTWRSIASGHTGRLKAVATSEPAAKGRPVKYHFHYYATWAKVLSGTIHADHSAKPKGKGKPGAVDLTGEKDLGRLGGVYSFTGTATPTEFKADYKGGMDHGVFEMQRPVK